MDKSDVLVVLATGAYVLAVAVIATGPSGGLVSTLANPATAAWVQAAGGFGAIYAAYRVGRNQAEAARVLQLEMEASQRVRSRHTAITSLIGVRAAISIAHVEASQDGLTARKCRSLREDVAANAQTLRSVPVADVPAEAQGNLISFLQLANAASVLIDECRANLEAGLAVERNVFARFDASAVRLGEELDGHLRSMK